MRRPTRTSRRGFNLVEVTLALGVFSLAIVAIIGLLTPTQRQVANVADRQTAARLADLVQSELTRVSFDDVATAVTSGSERIWLVATRDASLVRATGADPTDEAAAVTAGFPAENAPDAALTPGIAERDRYFAIEVTRLTEDTADPLYYNAGATPRPTFLALRVVVAWPYFIPEGAPPAAPAGSWDAAEVQGLYNTPETRSAAVYTAVVRR